jgi:hypothetical protein
MGIYSIGRNPAVGECPAQHLVEATSLPGVAPDQPVRHPVLPGLTPGRASTKGGTRRALIAYWRASGLHRRGSQPVPVHSAGTGRGAETAPGHFLVLLRLVQAPQPADAGPAGASGQVPSWPVRWPVHWGHC